MKADTLADALAKGRGIERPFRCHIHDDTTASASVNTATGLWYCFACGAAGKADENTTIPDADTLLEWLAGTTPPRIHPEAWLDVFDANFPSSYWTTRYGEETATHYRCGTHPYTGEPTYPIRTISGDILGIVTRTSGTPKYKYPYGVPVSKTFFGDYAPARRIILVEGASDVMALHQAGIPDDWCVLGCFGAGLHAPQIQHVIDAAPRTVVCAFDNDQAGHKAAQRAAQALSGHTRVLIHTWEPYNDAGDAPVESRIAPLATLIKEAA